MARAACSCCCRPAVRPDLPLFYAALLFRCYVCVRACGCVGSLAGSIFAFSAPTRRDVCLLPGLMVGPLRLSPTSNGRRSGLPPVCRPWGLRSYFHPKASLSLCVSPPLCKQSADCSRCLLD